MFFFHIFSILNIVLLLVLLTYEYRRDLMMLQQNSYRPERYSKWLRVSKDSTSYRKLFGIFIFLFCLAGFGAGRFALILVGFFSICAGVSLARKRYKKPLVFTARVKRLMTVMCLLTALIVGIALAGVYAGLFGKYEILPIYTAVVALLFSFCISHFLVFCSYYILQPFEKSINRKFYKSAENKLRQMPELKVIGITGSYGKTSTKHFLHRILSEQFETLMTPGSFNTTLGVVRTVNEHLKPYHEVFIVEMGAKQSGDIREICNLVHPTLGILTAVGPQHLETFRTIENVRNTKFELIDSLPSAGCAILNDDYPIIAERKVDNCRVLRYSTNEKDAEAKYFIENIKYHSAGTTFELRGKDGAHYQFETKLFGDYNITNLAAAIITALQIGVPADKIMRGVKKIQAVEHRFCVNKLPNGVTILDDAFNSNPAGSSMAVKVLSQIDTGRKIIITPGMIELGERQYELNEALGSHIAEAKIDYAVIIGEYNKEALSDGLLKGNFNSDNILYFNTFLEANAWMTAFAKKGDVVLIENDLPDTFK